MRKIILAISVVFILSCSDDSGNCVQDANETYSRQKKNMDDNYYSKSKIDQELTYKAYQERLRQIQVEKDIKIANCL